MKAGTAIFKGQTQNKYINSYVKIFENFILRCSD